MDPLWAQVGVTAVLVGVTIYYAYQVRKSNKNIWKLEKEREERQINMIRDSLMSESWYNSGYLKTLLDGINEVKQNNEKSLPKYRYKSRNILYKALLDKIGILPQIETWVITEIYTTLDYIDNEYKTLVEDVNRTFYFGAGNDSQDIKPPPKVLSKDTLQKIDQLEKDILSVVEGIEAWQEFFEDKDISKFEEKVEKLFK